jgi:hypothetical protein
LSTINKTPFDFAIVAIVWISDSLKSGLVGVSIQINFVFCVIAASIEIGFVPSTKVVVTFWLAITLVKSLYVPPYKSSAATILSPGLSIESIAVSAASPEAKARPYLPFSSAAIALSKAVLVGFLLE